jgi:isoamylase
VKDLAWFGADGSELTEWFDPSVPTLAMYLDGHGIRSRGPRGERIVDDTFLVVLHTAADDGEMLLPKAPWATSYDVVLDTTDEQARGGARYAAGDRLPLVARSVQLLRVTR